MFENGIQRSNTRTDWIRCEADFRAGRITNFDDCERSQGVVSNRSGSQDLKPEESENLSLGGTFQLDMGRAGRLTFTADYWEIRQKNVIGLFGDALDEMPLSKTHRYWIDPRDILQAQKYARDRNLDIIGIYHSHTDNPAIPSECDRAYAWSQYAYLIVAVQNGRATEMRNWCLNDYRQFEAENVMATASVLA